MSKKIVEMKEERMKLLTQYREVDSQFREDEMPAEKRAEMDKIWDEIGKWDTKIQAEERRLEVERRMGEGMEPPQEPRKGDPAVERRELFAKALQPGNVQAMNEYRAMTLGTDAQAGYLTAPVDFRAQLITELNDMVHVRRMANIVGPIGMAQSLGVPYRSVASESIDWTAEVTDANEDTALAYGRREFKPNKLAKMIKVSKTLARHSSMIDDVLRAEMAYKIGIAQENGYLNGNGTAQPLGVFQASATGVPTAQDVSTDNAATYFTADGLINAKYGLKQQYWAGAEWIMHRDAAKMAAKLKDGEGQYLWQGALAAGQPDRLLGFGVNLSEYAPNTFTSGLYVGILGNFKAGYWVCDADELQIQVLNELYAVGNQIGYLVDYFGDGAPVIGEAFVRVKLG